VVGLEGVRAEIAMLETPDGHGRLELSKFHAPSGWGGDRHAPPNTPGIRHVTFAVDDIDAAVASVRARGGELVGEVENYQDFYRLCYVRAPGGDHRRAGGADRPRAPADRQPPRQRQWSSRGKSL
jgi:predicted enzyme related to lactoylglutathione lyase